MELKYVDALLSQSYSSFNRTFMELKYYEAISFMERRLVLIVPLWN